ncbi:hypothetical protein GCM10017044_18550 [Kordiimonas sediminis]|uniref:Uncharacterized protein n=1 Tax=Kordiimonas sediminis TaxID=1735581 RepID=A0A919E838_9PROT|nr:hypothetical protein [Kordiimonas sediminis]GHF24223.1 hypothetical protein GCM10017044_18550 [Kordiimonas sediminis]
MKPDNNIDLKDVDLVFSVLDTFPDEFIDEFREGIWGQDVKLYVEKRPEAMMFAAIDWFIPTAVFLFIAKSYFDGFLSQMGQDHYLLLKTAFSKLIPNGSVKTVKHVSSPNKSTSDVQCSSAFSCFIEVEGIGTVKFSFIEENLNLEEVEQVSDQLVKFLQCLQKNRLSAAFKKKMLAKRQFSKLVIISYDVKANKFVLVEPKPDFKWAAQQRFTLEEMQ